METVEDDVIDYGYAAYPEGGATPYKESYIPSTEMEDKLDKLVKLDFKNVDSKGIPTINKLNTNQNKMKRGYSVLKLSELASQLSLPSSKGYKTKDYLEHVIGQIEENGYKFIQFLQLVDVLYVIVQKMPSNQPDQLRPEEEIKAHYSPPSPGNAKNIRKPTEKVEPVQERETVTEAPPELENVKKRDHLKKSMKKNPLPWENKH